MFALLPEGDGGALITHPHVQRGAARTDRKLLIAQLSGKVKRFARGLFTREPQGVLLNCRLDRLSHRGCRPEVPIRRRRSLDPLVRALEVVVLDKKRHPTLTVLEVREHRSC